MLGKGLESLIPAGGYKKSDDSSLQSYSGPSQQAQSDQVLGAYTELVVQNNSYAGMVANNAVGDFALAPQPTQSLKDIDVSPISPPPQIIATLATQLAEPVATHPQTIELPQMPAEAPLVSAIQDVRVPEIVPIPETIQTHQTITEPQDRPPLQSVPTLQSAPLQPVVMPQVLQSAPFLQPMPLQPVAIPQASENRPILQSTISPQSVFSSHTESLVPSDFAPQVIPTQINNSPRNISPSQTTITSQIPVAPQNTSFSQVVASSQLIQSPTERIFPSAPTPPTIITSQIASNPAHNSMDNDLLLNPVLRENIEEDYSRKQASVFQIEVEKISPNPHQPRRHFDEDALNELANSIREFGIIQPLIVTKILKETELGTEVSYQLIAGERRLMAAKKVGLRTVPVVIRHVGIDRERLELAIIENVQRENLGPLETARGYARLQDEFRLTQREIATRIGKSRETVANTLRLLHLPSEIQQALDRGAINESHARLLLQINDISKQRDMFESILRTKPSVRDLKAIIKKAKTGLETHHLSPELISLQSRLEEFLGTKTQIDDDGGKGKITINYYSPEELNALIHRLSGADI